MDLYVHDEDISDPAFAGLNEVNVTLMDSITVDENITTYLTDANGFVQLRIPSGPYNFSINYQGTEYPYHYGSHKCPLKKGICKKFINHAHDSCECTLPSFHRIRF